MSANTGSELQKQDTFASKSPNSSAASEKEKTYILGSSDGQTFNIDEQAALLCNVVKDMIKNLPPGSVEGQLIPVTNVHSSILSKVVEWINHHKDNPKINEIKPDDRDSTNIPEWDKNFLNVSQKTLFELIIAANFLDVKGLLDFCCKTIANLMKGKTVVQLRETFGIKSDFTLEEEEEIRRQNAWVEE